MSTPERRSRRQAQRRSPWPRRLVVAVAFVLVLAVGIAIGRALGDGPVPGVTQTSVRTLEPLPQRPATTP